MRAAAVLGTRLTREVRCAGTVCCQCENHAAAGFRAPAGAVALSVRFSTWLGLVVGALKAGVMPACCLTTS